MKFSDQEYNHFSDQAYEVDSLKNKTPWRDGDEIEKSGKLYKVLKTVDNLDNGMQAMVVAPMINDEVDITQIVIAYAGTNFSDGKDRQIIKVRGYSERIGFFLFIHVIICCS